MGIEKYTLSIADCDGRQELVGAEFSVETAIHPGFRVDHGRLRPWCVAIAREVVDGHLTHNELIDESIHVRIVSKDGSVIVDTLSDRLRHNVV